MRRLTKAEIQKGKASGDPFIDLAIVYGSKMDRRNIDQIAEQYREFQEKLNRYPGEFILIVAPSIFWPEDGDRAWRRDLGRSNQLIPLPAPEHISWGYVGILSDQPKLRIDASNSYCALPTVKYLRFPDKDWESTGIEVVKGDLIPQWHGRDKPGDIGYLSNALCFYDPSDSDAASFLVGDDEVVKWFSKDQCPLIPQMNLLFYMFKLGRAVYHPLLKDAFERRGKDLLNSRTKLSVELGEIHKKHQKILERVATLKSLIATINNEAQQLGILLDESDQPDQPDQADQTDQ